MFFFLIIFNFLKMNLFFLKNNYKSILYSIIVKDVCLFLFFLKKKLFFFYALNIRKYKLLNYHHFNSKNKKYIYPYIFFKNFFYFFLIIIYINFLLYILLKIYNIFI
ncbi:hypothetical protein H8356DRAFT_19958 [Neocallimastix lanati (nom. inval.)]|nr:hypothetical protein H8356DRAFT_19958 [Neocallimastix sp. JGI-2020a]